MKIDVTDQEFDIIQIALGYLVKTMDKKDLRLKFGILQIKLLNQAIEELKNIPVAPSGSMIYTVEKGANLI